MLRRAAKAIAGCKWLLAVSCSGDLLRLLLLSSLNWHRTFSCRVWGQGTAGQRRVRQLLCACGSVWWLEVQANYRWLGCVRPGGERIGVVMGCVGWPGAGTYRVYALCVCMLHV
jgi:hypothetical protein